MRKIAIVIFSVIIATSANAQGINFEKTLNWKQVKEKAAREHKYIFMDVYATWCVPCKYMNEQVFPSKDLGNQINNSFISVQVQMDETKQDSEFIKSWYADANSIKQQYKPTGYPSMFFFSPEGKLVHKTVGAKDVNDLIKESKLALDPKTQYYTVLENYKNAKMDTSEMKSFVFFADAIGEKVTAREVAQTYASHLQEKDLYRKGNLLFISRFLIGCEDKNFNIFLANPTRVNNSVGIPYFAQLTVMDIIQRELITPYIKIGETTDWTVIEHSVKEKYGLLGLERVYGNQVIYYLELKDWINFGKYFKMYYELAIGRSFLNVNAMSWEIVQHVSDLSVLEVAVKAMKYDLENYGQSKYTIDTYANLLYKTGKKDEAIEWESKAVKDSNNGKEFVEALEKMKRGEVIYK